MWYCSTFPCARGTIRQSGDGTIRELRYTDSAFFFPLSPLFRPSFFASNTQGRSVVQEGMGVDASLSEENALDQLEYQATEHDKGQNDWRAQGKSAIERGLLPIRRPLPVPGTGRGVEEGQKEEREREHSLSHMGETGDFWLGLTSFCTATSDLPRRCSWSLTNLALRLRCSSVWACSRLRRAPVSPGGSVHVVAFPPFLPSLLSSPSGNGKERARGWGKGGISLAPRRRCCHGGGDGCGCGYRVMHCRGLWEEEEEGVFPGGGCERTIVR